MKETNGEQGVGASEFDLSNSQHPNYRNNIYYGNQSVPHPTNSRAKEVNKEKVLSSFLKGK